MLSKSTYKSFFNAIYSVILSKEKSNKTSVEKLASSFGITDKNTIKEITETAIVTIARKIANQPNKTVKQKYDEIVDLYKSQVNLSHRTSQSMLLQQYSTPATIGFLMGIYCKIDQPGNYYEPSAGNGMLTIANSGKDFTVNEIDRTRFQNLEFQDIFKLITKTDSSQETYQSKYFDSIITNPPFATLNNDEYLTLGEYEIKHLDHKMAILALNSMKDNGKAAIIVGGHTSWDDKGRIQAGKNRIFLSYLYKNYNVEDIILIDGNALYSKMGTGFDTRIILINGRKPKAEGFAPLKNDVLAQVITTTDDLYSRFLKRFEDTQTNDKKTLLRKVNPLLAVEPFIGYYESFGWKVSIDNQPSGWVHIYGTKENQNTNKGKALRLRAKAISIKQKQLFQIGQLGYSTNEIVTIDDYFENTKGSFKPVATDLVGKLMDAYLVYRRKKVKPEYLEVENQLYVVDFESQKKSSFFRSRSNSFYFQPKGKKQIIRISDHWSKSKHTRSQKHNCGFIASCYWENLTAERVSYRLPGEKYSSELMGGLIDFKNLKRI